MRDINDCCSCHLIVVIGDDASIDGGDDGGSSGVCGGACALMCAHTPLMLPLLWFSCLGLFVSCVFMVWLTSLIWSFSYTTFCRIAFVKTCCLNFTLSWDILFSSCMITESFAGYSNGASSVCGLQQN